jgi:hypothetical protein
MSRLHQTQVSKRPEPCPRHTVAEQSRTTIGKHNALVGQTRALCELRESLPALDQIAITACTIDTELRGPITFAVMR